MKRKRPQRTFLQQLYDYEVAQAAFWHRVRTMIVLWCGTVVRYGLGALVGLFCFVPVLLLLIVLPEKKRLASRPLFWFLCHAYCGIVRGLLMPITIEGQENTPDSSAIWVANHASALDIPVLGSLMKGRPHVWFVIDRFKNTPLLGFFVRRMSIMVDQASSIRSARALVEGIRVLQKDDKVDVLIFPEGGRFIDGTIHPFFSGFAVLAQKSQRPVVPVMMHHLGDIYPPHSLLIYPQPIRVVIGIPFVYADEETTEVFARRVYDWFVAETEKK